MSLSATCIHRPVLTWVMSIIIVLFGVIGFTYLGVREYPNVDPAVITVDTSYPGANAEVIESQITAILEEDISAVPGIRTINSTSREGRSSITIEFDLGVDLETAANDVRDKVAGAVGSLPPDADPPVVSKADADAFPIIVMNISSNTRSLLQLSELADKTFKERLQTIPGVAEVRIFGEKRYAMRLWMDPAKLAAYQVTPLDVRTALNNENLELPAGRIEGNDVELTVRTLSRLERPEEFNNLIIREQDGRLVRFSDIGYAELAPENLRQVSKGLAGPRVAVAVVPQPGSNHIAIADEFFRRLDAIKDDLGDEITLSLGWDTTQYIRRSIAEVKETIFSAFGLVVLIIFLFLRDWRTTLIPVFAVPISLVGAFFIMYLAGFSINVLTLLGLVLAIGLVVDDAIVVLENIYAKIEDGMPPLEAAVKGSREVYFAIISTTVALIAVFMPIVFLQGLTGRLFKEFGIVIGGSVAISAFVALTLTPMLSGRMIEAHPHHNWFYRRTEPFFERLSGAYERSLAAFMRRRGLGFVAIALAAGMVWLFGTLLPQELAPMEDRSRFRMISTAPEGTSFERMDKYMDSLIELVRREVPEAEAVIANTSGWAGGANAGNTTVTLVPPEQRRRSQQEIAEAMSRAVRNLNEARTIVNQEQTIAVGSGMARFGLPVQYVIQAPNFAKLKEVLPKFMEQASAHPAFSAVDLNLKFNKPELVIAIDRDRARALGVSVREVAQTLQLTLSDARYGYFIKDGKQYQVLGQLTRPHRDEPVDLTSIFVRNNRGELVQLDNLVKTYEQSNPPQLYRFNRYIAATVSAALAPGYTLGDGIQAMDEIAAKVLDESFRTTLAGAARDFAESSSSLIFVFILALVLTYLILAAQFESFRDPFIIMFTVPLAVAGALFSLWYFNQTLNIFSQIGQIMLIGLVTKNGILIVEFANQRKAAGLSVLEAVQSAAVARFRPILMTSLSTILGILPIAMGWGAGSESRVSMGIAVVGGMIFASGLTLYVIPAIYSYFSREFHRPRARAGIATSARIEGVEA
ncbi:MAG: efflux RND transporter permease subunit [candidate division KSB1 bacterium]|nr:efflux RND transporter permease subunit [candidate division KSB1 bacterium]MDZ7275299.1 efflux RND transporter permease subunit [candidate division KSB1 bacterium]MDZ7287467.1 efflux RND transporter permease subunit [candidate division KSB1 bacterium]MDZ7299581.1 efflux RND transporter permease subunit [candidate division KSB1 bacterium]MDZ7307333.1 efflux RND transporter permease subunit [candidate division KSB1 bacterium]